MQIYSTFDEAIEDIFPSSLISQLSFHMVNALRFTYDAHESIGQERKGGGQYFVHPWEVFKFLFDLGVRDEATLVASLFHDILEDVYPKNKYYSPELIASKFTFRVLRLVFEVTDVFTKEAFPQYNRAERKRQEAIRLASVSDEGKVIKLADIWNNGSTLDQSKGFGEVWGKEKQFLLRLLMTERQPWVSLEGDIRARILIDSEPKQS